MAEATPARGNKRNSLSRGEDGPALPLNKRMQSPVVITGPDGKILTKDANREILEFWTARSKFDSSVKPKHQVLSRLGEGGDKCSNNIAKKPSCMRQPTFSTPQAEKVKSVHFQTPISSFPTSGGSPLPASRAGLGTIEYASTPLPSSNARPPLSGRKLKMKAAAKLRLLDDHENQASRLVQARLDFFMGRQERAFTAWLNHVLDRPATGGSRLSNFEDFVSRNSSVNAPNPNSLGGDLKLIDEVYWDEECENASPRNPLSMGKSPRSALRPLNGLANRNMGSPAVKRPLKDTFSSPAPEKSLLGRTESPATPYLSSKRLKMITEHGFSYSRDLHMQDVCRLSDLARRLKLHFDQTERDEILNTITHIAKHIDEGRLRMKKGCAILTDVALRRKALFVLLNYNPYWLRIGLHVVLGHTALLKTKLIEEDLPGVGEKEFQNEEYALLEVFIERHFLAHAGISKAYATNKAIDGLYREGYSEALGRVILKRFFLLVLVLDKAKRQTSLKITDGIDGLDGGSPSLFRPDARVKSSRQALQEFLSDVLHGEGDVIGNLGNLGYHVYHHQVPLADYDFAVVDLIEDLQDGVRLCRLVQLLAANDTFFLEHIQVPSNGRKRQLHNCQIALESLAQAGVPLEDEQGCSICAEDIVGGNRDKVFPLLWNIMVHLQIPLLVSRPRLCQEIAKLQGTEGGFALGLNIGTVELLLKWTQVACMISGNLNIRNFQTSFADGQALCYILSLYLPLFLPESDVLRPSSHINAQIDSTPNLRGPLSPAYKKAVAHNFGLVQAVARKLGNIPEVLQLVDLLGDPGMSERNIIIFVAFLCSRLLKEEPLDIQVRERRDSIEWEAIDNHSVPAADVAVLCSYSSQCSLESESPVGFDRSYTVPWSNHETLCNKASPLDVCSNISCNVVKTGSPPRADFCEESLGIVCKVQARWKARRDRARYLVLRSAVQTIQKGWRTFAAKVRSDSATKIQAHWRGYLLRQMFLRWKEVVLIQRACQEREHAALVIQAHYRSWVQRKRYLETLSKMCKIQAVIWANEAREYFLCQLKAVQTIEAAWLDYLARKRVHHASIILPHSHWQKYTTRQSLIRLSTASSLNQNWFRDYIQQYDHIEEYDDDEEYKMVDIEGWMQNNEIQNTEYFSGVIQAHWRGRMGRKRFLEQKLAALRIQRGWRWFAGRKRLAAAAATLIQAKWRSFICRRNFVDWKVSSITIQRCYRGHVERRRCRQRMQSVIRLQSLRRLQLQRRRYDSIKRHVCIIQACWRAYADKKRFLRQWNAAVKLQATWRSYQSRKSLHSSRRAATILQQWYRCVLQRRAFLRFREGAVVIQASWRASTLRKEFLKQRTSAVIIQGYYRAHATKRNIQIVCHVCKIQATWRALQIRRLFLKQRKAAVIIQTRFRAKLLGHKAFMRFVQKKNAVLFIESCYRSFTARMNFRRIASANRIQKAWRRYIARREFLEKKKAALLIQCQYRTHVRRKVVHYERCVCKIQASWRSLRARRQFLELKRAAGVIWCQFRGLRQRRLERTERSICKVQAIWRGRKIRAQLLQQKRAVVAIQAHYRGHKARQKYVDQRRAACVIQASFRAFSRTRFTPITEPTFQGTVRSNCQIQAVWKSMMTRHKIAKKRRAVQTIQVAWRGYVWRRQDLSHEDAAIRLQSRFRAHAQRRKYLTTKDAALAAQSNALRRREAIVKIQSFWRRYLIRKELQNREAASKVIQARFRSYCESKRFRSYINAVVQCQALVRGYLERRSIQRSKAALSRTDGQDFQAHTCEPVLSEPEAERCAAALKIQSAFKGWSQRQRFMSMRQVKGICEQAGLGEAVPILSPSQEMTVDPQINASEDVLRSVLKMQAMFRLAFERRKRISSRSTRNSEKPRRLSEQVLSNSTVDTPSEFQQLLQPGNATYCSRLEGVDRNVSPPQYEECEKAYAAMMIQACWRGYCLRKNIELDANNESDSSERDVDSVRSARFADRVFSPQELSACHTIVRWLIFGRDRSYFVRLMNATPVIQRNIRGWLQRRKFNHAKKAIVTLQAHWKGYLLRRVISQINHELGELRYRIQCTAATVQDSDRLGNRLTEALALLLGQKTVTGILSICRTIDVATLHSRSCCDRLAEAGAVTKILNLIQTINRSPPHEQVLKHALSIINNLAHYVHLRILIAEAPGAISIITEQMHMFRNKDEILAKAIAVLRRVCELPVGLRVLQREPPIFRRLQLVAQSLERKIQIEKRNLERLPPTTAAAQKRLAERKVVEVTCQFTSLMHLLKEISKLERSQRRKTTPLSVPPPSVSKKAPTTCRRPSLATRPSHLAPRTPLQDRTNW